MQRPAEIVFTDRVPDALREQLRRLDRGKVFVLVDENTEAHCLSLIAPALPPGHTLIRIDSGEEHKNLDTCRHIWQCLTDGEADRRALLINLGGGVIGDMGGFCAATFKRGIAFLNIPTTLLAQVDASIGGKLGIDFAGYKNHIGLFQEPAAVLLDPVFLHTLPPRELRSGFAEIIKHCLIADGPQFEALLQLDPTPERVAPLIRHSVEIKSGIVAKDPRESGRRKILNFGHTIGHAIESHYLENPGEKLLHGEAIAIGMICEAFLSWKKTGLPRQDLEKITAYLAGLYKSGPITMSSARSIVNLTVQDKKNEEHTVKCALLSEVGACTYNIPVSAAEMTEAIAFYNDNAYTK